MASQLKILTIQLDKLKGFSGPKSELEQWRTPGRIAAEAALLSEPEGKSVIDLGCGTGILSIAASLLGAKCVTGVDIDTTALEIARKNSEQMNLQIDWVNKNALNWEPAERADTCLMNPPFDFKHDLDTKFVEQALKISRTVYALLSSRGRQYWLDHYSAEVLREFDFPLKRQQWFHKRKSVNFEMDLVKFV
ncbi:MAG: methyltransferase [Candidatus Altiarchaeota archaeon]|nr:methyltransferase [Candidatus Altiarchaeota archaeon]